MLTFLKRCALLITLVIAFNAPAHAQPVDAAIVLVADVSGSMDPREQSFVRRAHARAVMSRAFHEGLAQGEHKRLALAYVEFSNNAVVGVDWTVIDGLASAESVAEGIRAGPPRSPLGPNTAIGAGMTMAADLLRRLPWRAGKMVVDVLGDGMTNMGRLPQEARDELVAMGAVVNAMPVVGFEPAQRELDVEVHYRTHVAGGPGHFVMPVRVMDELPAALRRKLVLELF